MQIFVKAADDAEANSLERFKCVNLKVDQYLNKPKLEVQFRRDFDRYKAVEKPSRSYNTRRLPPPAPLENRLLLFAETQIGKTGAFTHFLINCVQERRYLVRRIY